MFDIHIVTLVGVITINNTGRRSPQRPKKRKRAVARTRIRTVRKFLFDWYKNSSCVDCGETDPIVLQSDHVGEKSFAIANAAGSGFSIERLKNELNKCVTRCANCHMRKTANDLGWYKDLSM